MEPSAEIRKPRRRDVKRMFKQLGVSIWGAKVQVKKREEQSFGKERSKTIIPKKTKALKKKRLGKPQKRSVKMKLNIKSAVAKEKPISKPKKKKAAGSSQKNVSDVSAHKEKDLLSDALMDLNKELKSLRSAKRKLENKMKQLSNDLGSTQNKEVGMRDQISKLMQKEALLVKKKASTKDKMTLVDSKIEKVKAIGRELKDV